MAHHNTDTTRNSWDTRHPPPNGPANGERTSREQGEGVGGMSEQVAGLGSGGRGAEDGWWRRGEVGEEGGGCGGGREEHGWVTGGWGRGVP